MKKSSILLGTLFFAGVWLNATARGVDKYAAFAYSESTLAYGLATSENSWREAFDAAVAKCGDASCFVRVSIENGCLAFARDERWDGIGFASNVSLDEAKRQALLECHRPWENNCTVEFHFCTTDSSGSR